MNKLILIVLLAFAGYTGFNQYLASSKPADIEAYAHQQSLSSDSAFANAFKNRASHLQLGGHGTIVKVLSDDNNGSRHQRFIVRLNSGLTLLVAHNIDFAPRVASLDEGDSINFYGQYEWNQKGGLVHWTHADPNGFHVAGWIEHKGQKYQ